MGLQIVYEKSSVRSLHIFLNAKHFYFCHFYICFSLTWQSQKMREKSDKSKSAWHSIKYVTTELNFFSFTIWSHLMFKEKNHMSYFLSPWFDQGTNFWTTGHTYLAKAMLSVDRFSDFILFFEWKVRCSGRLWRSTRLIWFFLIDMIDLLS